MSLVVSDKVKKGRIDFYNHIVEKVNNVYSRFTKSPSIDLTPGAHWTHVTLNAFQTLQFMLDDDRFVKLANYLNKYVRAVENNLNLARAEFGSSSGLYVNLRDEDAPDFLDNFSHTN